MKNNYFLKMKIAAAFVFCLGMQNAVTAQTINVLEDTYVIKNAPLVNYGSGLEGGARDTTSSASRITYFKFKMPTGATTLVTSALLKFHVYVPSTTGVTDVVQVHKVASTWMENTVIYNDKPVTGAFITEVKVESVQPGAPVPAGGQPGSTNDYSKSYTVDITAYFNQALVAGDQFISIALKAKNKDDLSGTLGKGQSQNVRVGTKEAQNPVSGATPANYGSSITYSTVSLGVNDFKSNPSTLKVYPNPTNAAFTLSNSFESSDVVEVSVFNVLGAKVAGFKETVGSGVWTKELNAKELNMNKGLYIVNITSKVNGSSTSKVVVE